MKFDGEYLLVSKVKGLVQHEKNQNISLHFCLFFPDLEKVLIQIQGIKAVF